MITWKSKLPDTELGWSQEMDVMYYSLILSRDYYKKTKFMGKIGDKEVQRILKLFKILPLKENPKNNDFCLQNSVIPTYITGRLVTFNQS